MMILVWMTMALRLPIGNQELEKRWVTQQTPGEQEHTLQDKYLLSQTVPQILLLPRESHCSRCSYICTAFPSCFWKHTGYRE